MSLNSEQEFINLYSEQKKEKPLLRVNDCTFIELDKNAYDNPNFDASIIINGTDRSEVKDDNDVVTSRYITNIRHLVIISVNLMEGGILAIPMTIKVAIKKLNGQDCSEILYIDQVCGKISVRTGNSTAYNQSGLCLRSNDTKEIVDVITSYLDGFNGLENNTNLKQGLDRILPELSTKIALFLKKWSTDDIDNYIQMLKKRKSEIRLEADNAIVPIQQKIEMLQQIKDDRNK